MFFCCCSERCVKPRAWPKGATQWPTRVMQPHFHQESRLGGGGGVSASGSVFVRDTSSVSSNSPPGLPFGILMISLKKTLMVPSLAGSTQPEGEEVALPAAAPSWHRCVFLGLSPPGAVGTAQAEGHVDGSERVAARDTPRCSRAPWWAL